MCDVGIYYIVVNTVPNGQKMPQNSVQYKQKIKKCMSFKTSV